MSKSSFLLDFKAFVMRGNVVDMAVGVIIGGAFGKIISSVVADIIMPPIGLLVGGTNFSELRWELEPARVVDGVEQAAILSGTFWEGICFAIFLFIRLLSNLRRKKEETPLPPPVPSNEEKLLSEIRDLLKKQ